MLTRQQLNDMAQQPGSSSVDELGLAGYCRRGFAIAEGKVAYWVTAGDQRLETNWRGIRDRWAARLCSARGQP